MAPAAKPKASNRELSPKDAKAFKELLGLYETKDFKKALKTAEGILAHKPNHGETLCMKGLVLHNSGKQEEGYALVKEGTRNDVESHIVWHVHALMLKADKRYREALDCYLQACSRERDQPNLIRDAITLQLGFRMYDEVVEQRARLARLQPRIRANWLALSVALHLAGRHAEASKALLSYLDMQQEIPKRDYETSEVVLFQAMLLRADGKIEDALAWLDEKSSLVVDRPAFDRLRAELLLQTDQSVESNRNSTQFTWNALFESNAEDRRNVEGVLRAKGLSLDDPSGRAESLAEVDQLAEKAPSSTIVRLAGLKLDEGASFEKRVRKLLREWILKGVPSLFHAVRSLYAEDAKREAIERIVEGFRTLLEQNGTLDETTDADAVDAPTTFVWTAYFLAQHYSHLGQHSAALKHIEAALEHTPALPDLLMVKARILKRAGDLLGAEQAMTSARQLDGQDRFLNCKAVKYLLRLDQAEEAERIVGLFTRKEAPSPLADLTDLQALWFLQEQGDAYRRSKRYNLALKRYHTIEKIFSDWREDESDFHQWCNRKGTMRAYLTLLNWEDRLRSQPSFSKAAEGAIRIYLELDARPAQTNGVHVNGNAEADEAARKAAKKAKKAEAKARAQGIILETKKEEPNTPVDSDPNGDQLLATEKPLEEAAKFVRDLEAMASDRIETWLLSFDVAIRRKHLLHALKALRHATEIDRSSAELPPRLVQLKVAVAQSNEQSDPATIEYVRKGVDELFGFPSTDALVADVLQRHAGSPHHNLAAAESLIADRGSSAARSEVEGLIFQLVHEETRADLEVLKSALDLLRTSESSRTDEFRSSAAKRLPLANAFFTPEQLEEHKKSLAELSRTQATASLGETTEETVDG